MLFFTCLIISIPAVAASSVGAYNVKVTHDYVKATAVCSCELTDYTYHTNAFKNYCPHCDSYGTLVFNPKGSLKGNGRVPNAVQITVLRTVEKKCQIVHTVSFRINHLKYRLRK